MTMTERGGEGLLRGRSVVAHLKPRAYRTGLGFGFGCISVRVGVRAGLDDNTREGQVGSRIPSHGLVVQDGDAQMEVVLNLFIDGQLGPRCPSRPVGGLTSPHGGPLLVGTRLRSTSGLQRLRVERTVAAARPLALSRRSAQLAPRCTACDGLAFAAGACSPALYRYASGGKRPSLIFRSSPTNLMMCNGRREGIDICVWCRPRWHVRWEWRTRTLVIVAQDPTAAMVLRGE